MATDVDLAWTDTSGNEDGFRIRRSAGAAEPADWDVVPILDTVGPDVETYRDLAVADGDYWYNVRAYNAAGESTDVGTNIESITLPPAVGPAVILEDNFTAASNELIDGRTPDTVGSSQWVDLSNTFEVQAATSTLEMVSTGRTAWIETGAANCVIETETVTLPGGSACGIAYRMVGPSQTGTYTNRVFVNEGANELRLVDGGIQRAAAATGGNNTGVLKVELTATTVTGYLDVLQVGPYVGGDDPTATLHGFTGNVAIGMEYGYFKVTELP